MKDHFYFRLHPRFIDVVGFDITYEVKKIDGRDLYEVWFKVPDKKDCSYVLYEEETIQEAINNGDWIVMEGDEK